jgi:1,4-alpha-glucan branching enzyme/maltooligosyltrehalose trehalohydrolase
MKRQHLMPFGAEIHADGKTRFALWAPAAKTLALCLEGNAERVLAMQRHPDGWWTLETDAAAGSRYRYLVDGEMRVPDPASRFQPDDVHGASEVVDTSGYAWKDVHWRGRPWHEAAIYELHVGTFTPSGTFRGVRERLDYLVDLGVTAIELMPVADWPGARNWGYDGTYLFAPDSRYGRPEDLKELVDAAHARGLMVYLDVVYNHFGPEGNYLARYAPAFFTIRHQTPWGAAINLDGEHRRTVRDFFIHNALYWLTEYHIDGLRLDAVHSLFDGSQPDLVTELAETVRTHVGPDRHVHLTLENYHNETRYLRRDPAGRTRHADAQWNDDIHHALHVILTGEDGGYYADYADEPIRRLGRTLAQGFDYQGEISRFAGDVPRGEPSGSLPATAFVSFLQNHDQVGNRAFGDRISSIASAEAVRAAVAIFLLAPAPPLLFMGEEWAARQPFLFFCDFGADLADAVREGRRREFARFPEFRNEAARERIPDPMDPLTYERSSLDWRDLELAEHRTWHAYYRDLLAIRRRDIVPRLEGLRGDDATYEVVGSGVLSVKWQLGGGARLALLANLVDAKVETPPGAEGRVLFATDGLKATLDPWSVRWFLAES